MNLLFILVSLVALLLAAALLHLSTRKGREQFANAITAINITPKGRATYLASSFFTARYLLCTLNAGTGLIAPATAGSLPLGVVPDQTPIPDQANSDYSYPLAVNILGMNEDTERMVASAAIAAFSFVVPAASGQVQILPIHGGGTAYIVGIAKTAALAAGDLIEVIPTVPYIVSIPA